MPGNMLDSKNTFISVFRLSRLLPSLSKIMVVLPFFATSCSYMEFIYSLHALLFQVTYFLYLTATVERRSIPLLYLYIYWKFLIGNQGTLHVYVSWYSSPTGTWAGLSDLAFANK